MLRRLAESEAVEPLQELLRLVEPLRLGQRQRTRRATQLTPLTEFGDLAPPDPAGRREVAALVTVFLRDPSHSPESREALDREFRHWQELGAALAKFTANSPQLHELEGALGTLAELSAAGQQAIYFVAEGKLAPKEWSTEQLALLDRASAPQGLLRIAVVASLRPLITAVGNLAAPSK